MKMYTFEAAFSPGRNFVHIHVRKKYTSLYHINVILIYFKLERSTFAMIIIGNFYKPLYLVSYKAAL